MTSCDLETLLQHLLPTAHHSPDHSYTFTFLLCSRLFLRPDQLFQQIFFAHFLDCDATSGNGCNAGSSSAQKKLYKNFIENLLYEWITVFPYDFNDDRLMALFVDFAQKAHAVLEKNFARNLRKYMDRKLNLSLLYDSYLKSLLPAEEGVLGCEDTAGEDANEATENAPVEQKPRKPATTVAKTLEECIFQRHRGHSTDDSKGEKIMFLLDTFSRERSQESAKRTLADLRRLANESDIMDLCSDARCLAQQLTLIEFERLSFIGPQEFVQTFIKEQLKHQKMVFADKSNNPMDQKRNTGGSTDQEQPPIVKPKCPRNIDNYVAWFNRLSNLVAAEIVGQVKSKNRVKMCEFWIEVASECFEMRNLNSLMAIIAGLNLAPISRLKKMVSSEK